jgi:chemotaxis protein methyltransferase CheR
MRFDADSLGLQPVAVSLLREIVHERLGVYFQDSRLDALADRLAPLVADRGFASFLDYFYFLKYDADTAGEWHRVMDALSVPESYFWREVDQIAAIVDHVVPDLVRRRPGLPIRIASVPCASGEEPLTIAMMLSEKGWFSRARFEIVAGDASCAALARARAGVYRERAFRSLPAPLRERYFHRAGDAWQIDEPLHRRIHDWRHVNLASQTDAMAVANADVMFCRNVFIYFSDDTVKRVVNAFADGLPDGGLLCVGAAESLLRVSDRFELEEVGGAFVYVKRR